ncbi:MAG: 2-hydroxyacyl-CoA dehydratase, partial [Acidaminococcaceae bacterium]|nr:2-hydroxyacyl-CoA dehydratase [Acidaminococcaceae bacterium]
VGHGRRSLLFRTHTARGIVYDDPSEYGILRALSERYHKACICPTFTENERRVNNIINSAEDHQVKGVVYNLLKGCHPYDIEAITIEQKLKEHGLKFFKIETDYGREDSQNILTRLEAFRQTL